MKKGLIILIKSMALAFLLNCLLLIPLAQAQLSYRLIGSDELEENLKILRESIGRLIPGAKEIYIDYRSEKGQSLIKELNLEFIPFVLFDKGITEEPNFFYMVKNNLLARRDGFYIIPQEQLRLSDVFLLGREKIPERLELFVGSHSLSAKETSSRLINFIRKNNLEIDLKLRYITKFRDYGIDSPGGPEEIREDIRQLIIQKYFPDKFLDYLLLRRKNSYQDCLIKLALDKEKIAQLQPEGLKLLEKDARLAKELGITRSPTILWQNQFLIPSIEILMRYKPFNQKGRFSNLSSYSSEGKLIIKMFYSPHCNACQEIKDEFLPELLARYQDKIQIDFYDIKDEENYRLMLSLEEKYGVLKGGVPKVFLFGSCLVGGKEIRENLEEIIKESISRKKPR